MRKLKLLLAACALTGASATSSAQTDVTDTYIINAGFDNSGDFQNENVATGNSNQRKAVTGWTNAGGNTYTTGAAIGFGTSGQINGANLPNKNADGGTTGGALCLNAAWQSDVWYSQEVTLPAGNYTIKFMVNNVGKNEQWNNDPPLFTFITALNTFSGNVNSYPVNTWTEQTICFAIASETKGTIKIGYKSNNTLSGNTPKFVVDYVKAFYNSNYTATLQSAIDRATKLNNRISDSDLNSAIAAAQSVLNGAGNDVGYQATIDDAVTTLRDAIATAQAKVILEGEEDITYLLENANFESSPALTGGVCTYAYDCAPNGVFYSQMQQVEGWEVVQNGNGKSAGVYAFGSDAWLSGKDYDAKNVTSSIGEKNALGLVAAWDGTVQYKQAVTLPAGRYALTVPVFNSHGGTAITKNLIGFITDGGTEYLATTKSYPVGSTNTETINFTLENETSGYISLGYTAAHIGSANCPKMFIDAIKIQYFTADKSALLEKLNEAAGYQEILSDDALAAAITTAQAVYDNGQATQDAVDAQVTALGTAITTALANIANGTDVTALFVENNSFEKGEYGWTFNSAGDTGVKDNSNATYTTAGADGSKLFNTWGGEEAKYVKQSLKNLPDGYYVISALIASDDGNTVTLYAGDGTNNVTVSYSGKGTFAEGKGGVGQPTDGSMEIGATSTNWYKADKFQLFYYNNESDAQAAISASNNAGAVSNYQLALAAAQAALEDEAYLVVTGSERSALGTEIGKSEPSTTDGYVEATNALRTATLTFTNAKASYEAFATAANTTYEKLSYASNDKYEAIATAQSATDPTSAEDAVAKTNAILAAYRRYVESNAMAEGVSGAFDMTEKIKAPNFKEVEIDGTSAGGWTFDQTGGTVGIKTDESFTDGEGNSDYSYFNYYNEANNNQNIHQVITSLPAGRYLLSVTGRGHSNFDGNLKLYVVDNGSVNIPAKGGSGETFGRGWNDVSLEFELTSTSDVTIGVQTNNGKPQWWGVTRFRLVQLEVTPLAEPADYSALSSAISTAEGYVLGFEKGQYAPYKHVEALQALADAKAINPDADNYKAVVNQVTEALISASWTANTREVNAIYDGQFAYTEANTESGKINLPGWTKVDGIRLLVKDEATDPGLAYTDGKAAVFTWGGTTLTYGEQAGYTLPMAKYELYELTLKVSGWRDGDQPSWFSVELDGKKQVVTPSTKPINTTDGNPFDELKFYLTPTVDNSILKIYGNKHFTIADLTLVKATTPVTVTVGDDGYATYVAKAPLDFSTTSIKAYTAKVDGDKVVLTQIKKVATGTPVVLYCEGGKTEVIPFASETDTPAESDLVAGNSGEVKTEDGDYTNYILNNAKGIGFYYANGMTVAREHAYLHVNGGSTARLQIVFEGEATAISEVKSIANGEAVYNLSGQRVNSPKKGLYIIGGKKAVLK